MPRGVYPGNQKRAATITVEDLKGAFAKGFDTGFDIAASFGANGATAPAAVSAAAVTRKPIKRRKRRASTKQGAAVAAKP